MEKEKVALLKLNMVKNIGSETIRRLIDYLGDISLILDIKASEIDSIPVLNKAQKRELKKEDYAYLLDEELSLIEKERNLKVITVFDAEYPDLLKTIHHAPPVLYIMGDESLLVQKNILLAVVGTRTPNSYGQIVTDKIVSDLAAAGIVIVSGLAIGIDTIAHKAALRHGNTIAVLGSGIYNIYPSINRTLAEKIMQRGLVISEFPLRSQAVRQNFPQRNRLISGMSNGVLVTQAPLRSGALITVEYALEQGRDVFAVPGNINSPVSVGSNKLIQDGAHLVMDAEDIIFFYGLKRQPDKVQPELIENDSASNLSSAELKILEIVKKEPLTADQVFLRLKDEINITELQHLLLNLELNGYIKRYAGAKYVGSF